MKRLLSLRAQLTLLLGLPLIGLLFIDTVASYLIEVRITNALFDRWLLDSAKSLAQEVRRQDGELDFPGDQAVLDVFGWDEEDDVYLQVSTRSGRLIAGSPLIDALPLFEKLRHGPLYVDHEVDGRPVRSVSVLRYADSPDEVVITVGETTNKRREMNADILRGVVISKGVLVAVVLVAVLVAVVRGLRPLSRLMREIGARSPRDLSPIAVGSVPLEVRGLVDNTNELLLRIERAIGAREQFIGNMAHQTRTPLAGIKLDAELALRDDDISRVRRSLTQIVHAADHMTHVNSQLLKLARAEVAHGRGPHRGHADFSAIVDSACRELRPRAESRHITLTWNLPATRVEFDGEYGLLVEMVKNLVDNGIVHGRAGGHVWVRLEDSAARVELVVEDDGPGIGRHHWPRIYDRFYRPPESPGEGCGLGLPIVREIALAHDAELELADRPGGGTRFVVRFLRGMADAPVIQGSRRDGR